MATVTFEDLGRSVAAQPGQTLLEVCDTHGLPMETACGGFAACNSCRVRVVSGALSPLDPVEDPFLDRPDQRLGCQARVVADVVVRLDAP
jgi:adenylate cyclase